MVGFSKHSSSTPSGKSPHSGSYQVGEKTVQYEMKGAEYDSYTDVPYLNQKLEFTQEGSALLDANGYSIMMAWEKDIMYETAKHLAHPNADFLNIGYGMGYMDRAVESYGCRSHYIIEIHQDVWRKMKEDQWMTLHHVHPLLGGWKDYYKHLPKFDFVFFDTWGDDEVGFMKYAPILMKEKGTFSFFNNPRGDEDGLHMQKAQYDILKENFYIDFIEIDLTKLQSFNQYIHQVNKPQWPNGASYWFPEWTKYYIPICSFKQAPHVKPDWMDELPKKGQPGDEK